MDMKKTIEDLLNKSITLDDLEITNEQVQELENTLDILKKNSTKDTLNKFGASHDTGEAVEMSEEIVKFDQYGQWKIEKAIKPAKPGSTLDYGAMNNVDSKTSEANARTINYKEMESGPEIERRVAAKNKLETNRKFAENRKITPRNSESAMNTMQNRGQIKPKT